MDLLFHYDTVAVSLETDQFYIIYIDTCVSDVYSVGEVLADGRGFQFLRFVENLEVGGELFFLVHLKQDVQWLELG